MNTKVSLLKVLGWVASVITYVPVAMLFLCLFDLPPSLPQLAKFYLELFSGQKWKDLKKSLVHTTVLPPGPPNPNFPKHRNQQDNPANPHPRSAGSDS
jgi:hypothetical protein